jgi:hypothetical protein
MGRRSGSHRASTRRTLVVCLAAVVLAGLMMTLVACGGEDVAVATDAPEASKVLAVQSKMPFQIMIPAYLPEDFDRRGVRVNVNQSGPGAEPMVELVYTTEEGATVTLQEWVPVNPGKEILANSRPIVTKWGRAWLLYQEDALAAIWADVGPTRVSMFTTDLDVIDTEHLLSAANTLGPASNKQVFSFDAAPTKVKEVAPPKPFKVPVKNGVQTLTLVVTPGGYSPLRFSVRKDVPVKLTFRQLGQVGCGNELVFPADPVSPSSLRLASPTDEEVLKFTPRTPGTFEFHCSHQMYRGLMTVLP